MRNILKMRHSRLYPEHGEILYIFFVRPVRKVDQPSERRGGFLPPPPERRVSSFRVHSWVSELLGRRGDLQ